MSEICFFMSESEVRPIKYCLMNSSLALISLVDSLYRSSRVASFRLSAWISLVLVVSSTPSSVMILLLSARYLSSVVLISLQALSKLFWILANVSRRAKLSLSSFVFRVVSYSIWAVCAAMTTSRELGFLNLSEVLTRLRCQLSFLLLSVNCFSFSTRILSSVFALEFSFYRSLCFFSNSLKFQANDRLQAWMVSMQVLTCYYSWLGILSAMYFTNFQTYAFFLLSFIWQSRSIYLTFLSASIFIYLVSVSWDLFISHFYLSAQASCVFNSWTLLSRVCTFFSSPSTLNSMLKNLVIDIYLSSFFEDSITGRMRLVLSE